MGFAGAFTALRDFFGVIPAMLFGNAAVPGVAFGIYLSPMLLAVGFLVGTGAVVVWFVGALLANFGIIVGGSAAGLWDVASAQGIVSSLGMGVMMGAGLGVIFKNILPKAWRMLRDARSSNAFGLTAASTMDAPASGAKGWPRSPWPPSRSSSASACSWAPSRPSSWCCSPSSPRP